MDREEKEESYVTVKDFLKGITIAQLFVDSLAQHDPYEMEDILKLKRGEWNGQPLTRLGEIFQKNVEKLLQSFNKSENIINNNRSPEFETNYQIKRRETSLPKIMSVLFTASTSESPMKFDSHFNGEINTSTQLRRISPTTPPSPSMHNRDEYAHKNDELLHSYTTSENDKNRIIYPDIAIIDDDEEYKYRYNRIIGFNKRVASPFENRFSDTLEERFLCVKERSNSISSENRFSDNLKGRLDHKGPRDRSQSYESRLSNSLKGRSKSRKSPRNRSSTSKSRLMDSSKERFSYRKLKYRSRYSRSPSRHHTKSRFKTSTQNQLHSSNRHSRSQSKSEYRNKCSPKLHETKKIYKPESKYQTRSESNNRDPFTSQNQSQSKTRNRSPFKSQKHRKSEDYDIRKRSRKRSRSHDKTKRFSSHKSKRRLKSDDKTKMPLQNHNEIQCINDDQYSLSGLPQHFQALDVIQGVNPNAMIPSSPSVYRGSVPYYPPSQYDSTMVYYSQPGISPNMPPMRLQNRPSRGPAPYFMQPRPHFTGYAPAARHFY